MRDTRCHPIRAFWEEKGQPPQCMSSAKVLLGYELSNLVLDVTVLCLPIKTILQLRLPMMRKLYVAGMLLSGSFVCFASMCRLYYTWPGPQQDKPSNASTVLIWSSVQLGLAIVCCCLPTFGAIFAFKRTMARRLKAFYKSIASGDEAAATSGNRSTRSGTNRGDKDSQRLTQQQQQQHDTRSIHSNRKDADPEFTEHHELYALPVIS